MEIEDKKILVGSVMFIVCCALSFIPWVGIPMGIFLWLTGLFLVYNIEGSKEHFYIFLFAYPILLFIGLAVFGFSNYDRESAEFYFEDKYKGLVTVVYEQDYGYEEAYHEKTRIYKIPQNGVCITQFDNNNGSRKRGQYEVFYMTAAGKQKIPVEIYLRTTLDTTDGDKFDTTLYYMDLGETQCYDDELGSFYITTGFVGTYPEYFKIKDSLDLYTLDVGLKELLTRYIKR